MVNCWYCRHITTDNNYEPICEIYGDDVETTEYGKCEDYLPELV